MRSTLLVAAAAAAFAFSPSASAYPTMIGHGYTSCNACHVDPSGAGQLSPYGRAMSDLLVRWHLDPAEVEGGEPSPTSGFLFGIATLPDWLNVSGNLRGGGMVVANTTALAAGAANAVAAFPLQMATDLSTTLDFSPFVAHVSLGFGLKNMGPAVVITPNPAVGDLALVSREHWLGLKLLDEAMVVRGGRIPVPFGLRNYEHTSFVRALTRTDVNTSQQHGVSVNFGHDLVRTEVMALLGNYQIRPDEVRERGYAGFVEVFPVTGLGVGASSLTTWANADINTGLPTLRMAHGLSARWGALEQLAILAEADVLLDTAYLADVATTTAGGAAWLQADWSVIPGVHVLPAVEAMSKGDSAVGVWVGGAWYVLPHTELRTDVVYRHTFLSVGGDAGQLIGLLQLHLFL